MGAVVHAGGGAERTGSLKLVLAAGDDDDTSAGGDRELQAEERDPACALNGHPVSALDLPLGNERMEGGHARAGKGGRLNVGMMRRGDDDRLFVDGDKLGDDTVRRAAAGVGRLSHGDEPATHRCQKVMQTRSPGLMRVQPSAMRETFGPDRPRLTYCMGFLRRRTTRGPADAGNLGASRIRPLR
jgi:hypothetical protein